ncbi:SDR family NAD(P)-dependent oxidoreductase [Erythrobacter crassostreae]|uniref:SDR family NAD(P)-dependent oxidoreductase n=1 Tax=Erythrobacter crassostreae TaxID=2828328 RepID=A0A9X1F4L3_9SPHN|nr:SDR family NAD(P)-dependent oxidoreductase [Erythrobacter crassostrea]MBV7259233.1 SDR family NAD(P)-dependent oxidoreductase [Erythrobacter crassostrea]
MATILITGATDGIGLETAKKFAGKGHTLLLHGRSADKLKAAVSAVHQAAPDAQVQTYRADFADLKQVSAMAQQIVKGHAAIDVLINNAGVLKLPEPVLPSGHDTRFVVNTFAVDVLTRGLLPIIGEQGRVVTLSSAAQSPVDIDVMTGRKASGQAMDAYAQSKLAVTMWSRAMALTHPKGPAFIAVNPGSLLASKMVREGFGVAGKDLSIGADILVRAAEDAELVDASGRYFDNDARDWGRPHSHAEDDDRSAKMAQLITETAQGLI